MLKKRKIFKIILIISFVPYIILLLISLYYSIFGYDLYSMILPKYLRTLYGMEAFYMVLMWYSIAFSFIPILPLCFLYQIIYLVTYIIKRIKNKTKA